MAHGDYNCCAVCDCKMDYNSWDARTKEEICTDCLKALRAEGVNALDSEELIAWMKENRGDAKPILDRIHFSTCFYGNPVDACYNTYVVGAESQTAPS